MLYYISSYNTRIISTDLPQTFQEIKATIVEARDRKKQFRLQLSLHLTVKLIALKLLLHLLDFLPLTECLLTAPLEIIMTSFH